MVDLLIPSEAIPCPQCRYEGREGTQGGAGRIGSSRGDCKTCNRFAQSVLRRTQQLLKERHPDEFAILRAQVEKDLYPYVVADWSQMNPVSQAELAKALGL